MCARVGRAQRGRLGDRLSEARQGQFVGRNAELDLYRSALAARRAQHAVLYVHGPGGVGKTSLLQQYERLALQAGRPVVWLDGRDVEPGARGITFVLAQALGLTGEDDPVAALRTLDAPVILIDAYEGIERLDGWFRTRLFPHLGADCLVVIAGRNAPSDAWRTDAGWQAVTRVVPLRNLTPEEGRALLLSRGVAPGQVPSILRFTHGHPLALCLTAEIAKQGRTLSDLASAGADVVDPLLSRFVAEVPADAHRRALEVSAIAWRTTQPLLAAALGIDEAAAFALFKWLRALPFVEHGAQGIFPHDLVRDVIFEDLRVRHPDLLRGLVRRISAAEAARFLECRGFEQHQALWALLFVTRHHPSMQPFYDWTELGNHYAEPARPDDGRAIVAMVQRHEGAESARAAAFWFARQPEGFSVLRGAGGESEGFVANICIGDEDDDATAADPGVAALRAYVRRRAPLRPGELIGVSRFWMNRDQYQTTTVFNIGATLASVWWMTEPRLAWAFVVLRDLEFWLPMFRYVNFEQAEGAEFVVGGRRYGAVGHDWRAEPRMAWWRLLGERREASLVSPTEPRPRRSAPLLVLSEPAFKEAVRAALRDYTRPRALAANPLMRSRLVVDQWGSAEPPASALQGLLRAAVESLNAHPRDRKPFRALWHTYIEPERTQERAAEALGLPFSTYRRHLTAGIRHVADWLWRQEIGGPLPG